jgi:hypothetical protein
MLTFLLGALAGAVAAVVSPLVYRVVKDAVARAKTKFDGL